MLPYTHSVVWSRQLQTLRLLGPVKRKIVVRLEGAKTEEKYGLKLLQLKSRLKLSQKRLVCLQE